MLYSFAGYPDNTVTGLNSINLYNATAGQGWAGTGVSGGAFSFLSRGQAMTATTQTGGQGLGFFAGGGTSFVGGMVTFNASDPAHLSWSNDTNDIPYFWGPTTEYARFGNQGVLISVGGYLVPLSSLVHQAFMLMRG